MNRSRRIHAAGSRSLTGKQVTVNEEGRGVGSAEPAVCIGWNRFDRQAAASPHTLLLRVTSNYHFDDNPEEPADTGCDSHEYIHG